MNATDLQILKENQEKKLTKALFLVAENPFSEDFKSNVFADLHGAVMAIREQRIIVYKDTESVDHKFDEIKMSEPVLNEKGDIEKAKAEIIELVNSVIESESKIRIEVITNQSNFEKIKDQGNYRQITEDLNTHLSLIIQECMGERQQSSTDEKTDDHEGKYQLTEEDFNNNPDLKKEGLSAGDWVEIPKEALIDDPKVKTDEIDDGPPKKEEAHSPEKKDIEENKKKKK